MNSNRKIRGFGQFLRTFPAINLILLESCIRLGAFRDWCIQDQAQMISLLRPSPSSVGRQIPPGVITNTFSPMPQHRQHIIDSFRNQALERRPFPAIDNSLAKNHRTHFRA